ncbi:MAG: AsmA family protein [Paraperlucidibaca sp.]
MKRVLKWIAGIVALMVLSVSALAAYVVFVLDPNDYKQALTDVVKKKTDMDLALTGNLAWKLYPSIGISLGETSLKDPALNETLVAVKQASISVELMPLLKGTASVDAVALDGASVRFVQYANGKTSWDTLLEKLKSPDDEEPSKQVTFNIDSLDVTNTQLTLVDKAAGVTRTIDKIAVQATDIDPEKAFPLTASFNVSQVDDAGKSVLAENSLNAIVTLSLEAQKPHIEDLTLNSALSGNMLPAPVSIALKAKSIDADIKAQQHAINGMVLDVIYADPSRPAPISATINADIKADVAKGVATISPLKLTTTVTDKALAKPVAVALDTSATVNWKLGDISVPKLVATLDKIRLEANASVKLPALANGAANITDGMRVSGKLSTNSFNPRDVMANLGITPPVTKDPKALSSVSLSARLSGDGRSVLAQDLRIALDGSTITGEAGLRELPKARLYARLSLDKLNADNYLPPEKALTDKSPTDKGETKKAAAAILPVKLLREQNLDIGFKARALTILSYPITQLSLTATARDGLVNVSEFRGQVADGSFSVPATIDVRGKQPVITLKPNLNKIDLGPIAEKALKQDVFAGRMNFNGDVTVRGNTVDEWINSAKGPNTLRLNDGIIKGINVRDALFNALGQYQALLPALTGRDVETLKSKIGNTDIVSLLGDITLDQGVVRNESMKADLKDIQVGGSGTFNLQTNDVDYRFQLKLDKKYWGEKYAKMAEYAIPVRCNGNLQGSLTTLCGLDKAGMQGIVGQMAKARLNEEVDKQKGKLEEKLTEKLDPAQKEAVKQIFDLFKR